MKQPFSFLFKFQEMKYISIALLFTGLIIACEQPKSVSNLQKDAQCIAILQCEAKHLKDERFKAATDMNNLDDSLLHLKKKLSIPQERQFDSIKQNLTQRTAILADKISSILDSVWKNKYHTIDQRQELDNAVEKIFKESCH